MIRPVQDTFDAVFYDGEHALRRTAIVEVGTGGLSVAVEGAASGLWTIDTIRIADDGSFGEPVRLERDHGETLVIQASDFMESLRQHGLAKPGHPLQVRGWPQVLLCCFAIAAIGGAMYWWGIAWAAGQAARFMPAAMEDRLGRATVAILAPEESRCKDIAARQRIAPIVDRLSTAAGRKFTVIYVDQSVVNAFAAPGGYIVVYRGLLDQAATAEEFAGVLGHEMEHVILKHSARAIAREFSGRALLSLMSVDSSGTPAALQGAARLANLSYQREDEESADLAGLRLLAKAHIGTQGLAGFLRRMMGSAGSSPGAMKYLGTHPAMQERIDVLEGAARNTGGVAPAALMSLEEWRRARSVCGGE